jgi:hypothetical protein
MENAWIFCAGLNYMRAKFNALSVMLHVRREITTKSYIRKIGPWKKFILLGQSE